MKFLISPKYLHVKKLAIINKLDELNNYKAWLSQIYHMVCHSTEQAIYASKKLENKKLANYFASLVDGEANHEKLIENDMKALNFTPDEELPITKALYTLPFYDIDRQNPYTLLGYIMFLELLAIDVGPSLYEKIKKNYGKGYTFLKVHAVEDQNHVAEAEKFIAKFDHAEQAKIFQAFNNTADLYAKMLEDVFNIASAKAA